jgi:type I restriction enzyme R subunit
MDSGAAFSTMSKRALDSDKLRQRLKEVLLGPVALYEAWRQKGQAPDGSQRTASSAPLDGPNGDLDQFARV